MKGRSPERENLQITWSKAREKSGGLLKVAVEENKYVFGGEERHGPEGDKR